MTKIQMLSGNVYYSDEPEGIVETKINGATGNVGSVPMYRVKEHTDDPVPTCKINLTLVESIQKG